MELENRVSTLEREMSEVRKLVFLGNGHPPLVERVSNLEVSFEAIRSTLTKMNAGINRVVWLILSTVIGQILYAVLGKK